MADFLHQVFHPSVPFDRTIQLIRQNRNFKLVYSLDPKYHDVFQSQINSHLSVPAQRIRGFRLIQEYLMEIPKELLGDNFKNWATFCLSYIEGSICDGKNIALTLLDSLLKIGYDDDNTRRKLSLHVISPLVEYICRNNSILVKCYPPLVYNLLLTCVTKYPGSCGSKKNLINNFIVRNIHNASEGYEELVSLLANIHYCPTPGQSNLTSKNSWFDHFCATLLNINAILDKLKTGWGVAFDDLSLSLKKLPQQLIFNVNEKKNFFGLTKLERIYNALSLVICKMLQDTSTTGLSIPASSVLQLISRASSVKLNILYTKDPCLSLTLLSIQLDSLRVLEQLISTCRTALIPYSRFIHQSILGILENSSPSSEKNEAGSSSSSNPMCIFDLKSCCYQTLTKWFSINGPNTYIEKDSADLLFKNFMMDIKLGEKHIELRNIKKDKSSLKISDSSLSMPFMKEKLNRLHINCLKASSLFIANCFVNLSSEQLTFFATFVIEEVISLYKYSISSTILYEKPEARKELLSLILLLCQEGEIIPSNIGLNIIQKAIALDSSSLIRQFCYQSLRAFNGTINPCKILRLIETTSPFVPEYVSLHSNDVSVQGDPNSNNREITDDCEKNKNSDKDEPVADESMENGMDKTESITETTNTSNTKTNGEEEDENKNGQVQIKSSKTCETNIIMIQEIDDELDELGKASDSVENDDCIVYEPETDEAVKSIQQDIDGDKDDDDLEIVSIKSGTSTKREANNSKNPPLKKSKVVQDDSQSSSRSFTIIELTTVNDDKETTNDIEDSDIIKDFVAD